VQIRNGNSSQWWLTPNIARISANHVVGVGLKQILQGKQPLGQAHHPPRQAIRHRGLPVERRRLVGDRLDAVERFLDPRLLLGLEERVVLERIVMHVSLERHVVLECGVAPLQLEMVLDHPSKLRRSLYRHVILLL